MCRNLINVGLIFKNQTGIVSSITRSVYNASGNILNSKMVKIGNHFAFDLTANFPDGDINTSTLFTSSYNNVGMVEPKLENEAEDNYYAKANLSCSDNPGIIHTTAEALEQMGVDITELRSNVTNAPFSSTPLFNMEVEFAVDRKVSKETIKNKLEEIQDKYGCELLVA